MTDGEDAGNHDGGHDDALTLDAFYDALEAVGRPVVSASQLAARRDEPQERVAEALDGLAEAGSVRRLAVDADPVVYFPADWAATTDRERVVVFPDQRRIVVDQPAQFTRAQCSQFAHLEDTTRDGGYMYRIREEDIWAAPYDDLDALLETVGQVLGTVPDSIEAFVETQWTRARRFTLLTHEDGYTVLEAATDELMGNVARQHLDEGVLRAPISDREAWVADDRVAECKRTLYEAGYPVQDRRDLDPGDDLPVELRLDLRDYQRSWVERFLERGSGVFVGPPGSGKTVAAMGVLDHVEGETLVLVPSRELATQWRENLLTHTTLEPDQVGEYHGGEKQVRPVTIATYHTAGMDRHREIFDSRRWGLLVFDECHHIPSRVFRRTADLQGKHRLGLTATPVREDEMETDIFTLVGPPVGTDWDALFDAGFVAEPTVEIRLVPWTDEADRAEYGDSSNHGRRQAAAANAAKVTEIRHLLACHEGQTALVFVEYLDHGDALAAALDLPFVSGETPHPERERYFDELRRGERDALVISRVGDEGIDLPDAEIAIVASGLGGSRRQGAQRAGRTMRPSGDSTVYLLATRGTVEEDFARRQVRHLAGKGVRVRETEAEAVE